MQALSTLTKSLLNKPQLVAPLVSRAAGRGAV